MAVPIPDIFRVDAPPVQVRAGNRRGYGGRFPTGGPTNLYSGMGMAGADRGAGSHWGNAEYPQTREACEIPFVQSWSLMHALSIPPFVTMAKWRRFIEKDDTPEGLIDVFAKAERKWRIPRRLAHGQTAGNIYGTALLLMITDEAPLETPLKIDRIRAGSLRNMMLVDRYSAHVLENQGNHLEYDFGEPLMYRVYPRGGNARYATKDQKAVAFDIHASRVLRFDGISPLTIEGWTAFSNERSDWGLSKLTNINIAALQDQTVASAATSLSQEASIPVLNMNRYRQWISSSLEEEGSDIDLGGSPDERLAEMWRYRSNNRIIVVDKEDELTRLDVSFGGWPPLSQEMLKRVAAAARVPQSYFLGQSPGGLDSTGDGDMENFSMYISSIQKDELSPLLDDRLDMVLARDAGLQVVPEYEWNSLIDQSDQERADIVQKSAEALKIGADIFAIDNNEYRDWLNSTALFNRMFQGPAPEAPEPIVMEPPVAGDAPPGAGGGAPPGEGGGGDQAPCQLSRRGGERVRQL